MKESNILNYEKTRLFILTSNSREIKAHNYILVKNVVGDFRGKGEGFRTRSQCTRYEICMYVLVTVQTSTPENKRI